MRVKQRLAYFALAVGAAVTPACGADDGGASGPAVELSVSREFSRVQMIAEQHTPLRGRRTVARVVRDHADVELADSGDWVESIDGHASDIELPGQSTWAINVNGIESDAPADEYRLFPGDVVQLDLRYWYVTLDVRATVGAFPQTFTRGVFGRRFPVTVECQHPASDPCRQVRARLRRAGVDPDGANPPGPPPEQGNPRRAKILVGKWAHWSDRPWPRRIDKGARYSGVFARFSPSGDELRLLDWKAHRQRVLGEGAGLVAAMRPTEEDLLWVVTGTDAEGVARAADALNAGDLAGAFAVAVSEDGIVRLPLPPR